MAQGTRPQNTDFIGTLRTHLERLLGPLSLANELIQNAEDADATEIAFNFTDDALVVTNNKQFTKCLDINSPECDLEKPCDFHSFATVLSGSKQDSVGKIGRFGIGFTAVYQITDSPSFSSGDIQWSMNPLADEKDRIAWEDIPAVDRTEFTLPWVKAQTELRNRLRSEPITEEKIKEFFERIRQDISISMLFLDHIETLTVLDKGNLSKSITKAKHGQMVTFTEGPGKRRRWKRFTGDLADEISPDSLPERRKTNVEIAVSLDELKGDGLLFAFLPLEDEKTGFPFHIHADFFPSDERKRLLFEEDYKGTWNQKAIGKAAEVVAESVRELRDDLGHMSFWTFLNQTWRVDKGLADRNGAKEEQLRKFWPQVRESVVTFDSVFTSLSRWKLPSAVKSFRAPKDADEDILRQALEELGLDIVHPELSKFQKVLEEIGVTLLEAQHVINKVNSCGLHSGSEVDSAPDWFKNADKRNALFDYLKELLNRRKPTDKKESDRESLKSCPIAINQDGFTNSPKSLYKLGDPELLKIFLDLEFGGRFIAADSHRLIYELTTELDLLDAISLMERLEDDEIEKFVERDPNAYKTLVRWLFDKASNGEANDLRAALRNLKIWPSDGKFFSLGSLSVSGDFDDPLKIAKLVDLDLLGLSAQELKGLDANPLTFSTYVTEHVKSYFENNSDVPEDTREKLLTIIREKRKDWEDDTVTSVISELPLIKCSDGHYYPANTVYFDESETHEVLGDKFPFIFDANDKDFLKLIGVSEKPRVEDLRSIVLDAIKTHPDKARIRSVQKVIRHLGNRWRELTDDEKKPFYDLKQKHWLPEENNLRRWNKPEEICSTKKRHLFESVGKFVDLGTEGDKVEPGAHQFLKDLGVPEDPSVEQVVEHLLKCSDKNKKIDQRVYDFLQTNKDDPAIGRLENRPFIWDEGNKRYLTANQCFWNKVGFGRYRQPIGVYEKYNDLFSQLGVKNDADFRDATNVLREVSAEFSQENKELDDEAKLVVHHCWTFLTDPETFPQELRRIPSIVNNSGRLEYSERMFFDNFPGIAEKLGLAPNVIETKPDIFRAMQLAGIRFFSEVVQTELVDPQVESQEFELQKKLQWKSCFERILQKNNVNDIDPEIFAQVQIFLVSGLTVRFRVAEMNRESEPIDAESAFDKEKAAIYFVIDPSLVASELVRNFLRNPDPPGLASDILHVLNAPSESFAHKTLDRLNFPRVGSSSSESAPSPELQAIPDSPEALSETEGQEERGEILPNNEYPDNVRNEGSGTRKQDEPRRGQGIDDSSVHYVEGNQIKFTGGGENQEDEWIGEESPKLNKRSDSSRENGEQTRERGQQRKPDRLHQQPKSKRRGRLRSYVIENDEEETKAEDPQQQKHRESVDREGIAAVIEFEKKAGRSPEVMRGNNRGYDITSFSGDELKIERIIEVKSTSGPWDEQGVGLSKYQYKKAYEEGERFWLYVVEEAGSSNPIVHTIRNPARRVTEYFYDSGWKAVSRLDRD